MLHKYYEQSLEQIQRDIAALYARYATENGLTMAEARRLIRGDEFKVWRMTLEEYVKAAKTDSAILKELNTLAMRSRISRFEALHARTLMEIADLCEKLNQFEDALQYRAYVANFYGNLYDIHQQYGLSTPPVAVDKKQAENVIRTPWSGANYSTRIWNNGSKLEKAIETTILTAIHCGSSIQKLSKDLSQQMNVAYNNAERLIRTELNFVQTRAAADSIIAAEMGYYQFIAVMDNRTTPMCQSLDGEIFPIVELNQGENAPPMHVRCRSTICASIDDGKQGRKPTGQRAARDEDGKRIKIPADMRYADWKAVYIDKTKTLDDWRKAKDAEYKAVYVNKSPKFEKAKYRVAAKVRPLEEFLLMAKELQPIAEKYTGCKSLWSGKIVLTEKSLKNWDCNIWLWDDAPKHVLLHEMIHSCSVSYYSQDVFAAYKFEEELVVQYLCQEISQKEKIEIIAGGYDKGVELLRKIKRSLNLNISDLAFAQNLIKQPLGNRWEYLESLTINAATIEDYLKAIRQIEVLKKWKVLKKEN